MKAVTNLDWTIIAAFLVSVIVIGAWAAKRASKSAEDFFLSGRSMPWWLLGVSMVACTFSCDTPNLVTDIVRTNGVAGNWVECRVGDIVRVMETRPLSKDRRWRVVEIVEKAK